MQMEGAKSNFQAKAVLPNDSKAVLTQGSISLKVIVIFIQSLL